MSHVNIEINLDLSVYHNELKLELNAHMISLQILIENSSESSISNRKIKLGILDIKMPLITYNKKIFVQNEINKTFISTIRSIQNFIDKLIGVIDFYNTSHITEDNIKSTLDLDIYLEKKINSSINKISTSRSLNFPNKLDQLLIDEELKKTLIGYSSLRNSFEHHKNISSKEIELNFYLPAIYINNIEFLDKKNIIEKGSPIEIRSKKSSRLIHKGENIEIFESEIFEIIYTLSELIAPELINATYNVLGNK